MQVSEMGENEWILIWAGLSISETGHLFKTLHSMESRVYTENHKKNKHPPPESKGLQAEVSELTGTP